MPVTRKQVTDSGSSGLNEAAAFCGAAGFILVKVLNPGGGSNSPLEFEVIDDSHCGAGHSPVSAAAIDDALSQKANLEADQILAICCVPNSASGSSSGP